AVAGLVAPEDARVLLAAAHELLVAIAEPEGRVRRARLHLLLGEGRGVVVRLPDALAQVHFARAALDVDRAELAHPGAVERREVRRGLARGDDLPAACLGDELRREVHRIAIDLVLLLDRRAVVKADAEGELLLAVLRDAFHRGVHRR